MNRLHLTKQAQRDLSEIKRYISEELENPAAAMNTVKQITQNMRMLESFPHSGTPLLSPHSFRSEYRYLISGSYMVFYRTVLPDIYVERVLYGRRDYLQLLFDEEIPPDE